MSFRRSVNNFMVHRVKRDGFLAKKVHLWEILLHYFIQKKFAVKSHRIIVETYDDYAL